FMALVICCVEVTEAIRFLTSFKFAMSILFRYLFRHLIEYGRKIIAIFSSLQGTQYFRVTQLQLMQVLRFKLFHLVDRHAAEQALRSSVNDRDLLLNRYRRELALLQDFHVSGTFIQYGLGRGVQVG